MIAGSIGWLAGLLVASLAEYWVHVLMHRKVLLSRTHFNHHRDPAGETWAKQFAYYVLGGVPVVLPIAGLVWWAGAADGALGFVAGGLPMRTRSSTRGPSWCSGCGIPCISCITNTKPVGTTSACPWTGGIGRSALIARCRLCTPPARAGGACAWPASHGFNHDRGIRS
jgi:hypothetical protein